MKIILEENHGICNITLNNGTINSITTELLNDLITCIDNAEKTYDGIIITGNEKFFSMGFHLPELLQKDEKRLLDFYNLFNEFILKLYTLPIPTCSVLTGHAVAGGCIIALATDFRFAVPEKKIGLNEINLGLPVPLLAQEILNTSVCGKYTKEILYFGEFITTNVAFNFGLIDEIFTFEDINSKVFEKVKLISQKNKKAFSIMKANLTKTIAEKYKQYKDLDSELFLKCWFTDDTQSLLKEASKKF